jgi:GH25 family lysozyme M1 (1,4-beta-N-acetylmuramidase)
MPRIGPDISHHQARVDLARARSHVDFMFLKATQNVDKVDETFEKRWRQLAELGIPRGAYHFAIPSRSAASQAKHFASVVQGNGFRAGDAAAFDLEQLKHGNDSPNNVAASNRMSAKELNAWVKAFVDDVLAALPVENLVFYTGIPFWNGRMGHPAKLPTGCIGWLSRYRKEGPYGGRLPRPAAWPKPPDIWQFTDGKDGHGRVQNIPGLVRPFDCNEMTEACFQRLFVAAGLVPPLLPFPGTLERGDTGAGVERVQRNLNRFLPPAEDLTVNGRFDAATEEALTRWQRNRLIPEASVGKVGPGTWAMLAAPAFSKDLKLGSKGKAVRQLKHTLNRFPPNDLDTSGEVFDQATKKCVENWQKHRGQRVDGVVDMLTWYWMHAPKNVRPPDLHPA